MAASGIDPPVAPGEASGKLQRSPRRKVVLKGMFHTLSCSRHAALRNISCTGASIACDEALKVGAEGVLQAGPLDCLCRIVWNEGDVYGLAFDEPLPQPVVIELHKITQEDLRQTQICEARDWWLGGRAQA